MPAGIAPAVDSAVAVQLAPKSVNWYGPIRSDESPRPPAVVEPVRANTCASAPRGDVSVTTRSPTQVWLGANSNVTIGRKITLPALGGTMIVDVNGVPGAATEASGINPPGPGP